MRNVNVLNFEIEIDSNVENVWNKMLGGDSYKIWTLEFNPGGSWYEKENEGDFVEGEKIRFLGPGEDGTMGGVLSAVKTVNKNQFISFEHYGFIMNGVEDTESESVKSWVPSREDYAFEKLDDNKTLVKVETEMSVEWSSVMEAAWPKALLKLKEICEA